MRPLKAMGTAVLVVFSLIAVVELGAAFTSWSQYRFYVAAADNEAGYDEERETAHAERRETFGLLQVGALLVGAATFLPWFYRAVSNARASRLARSIDSPGWAIGCFFVPVLNIWKPATLMTDLAAVTGLLANPDGAAGPKPPSGGIVWLWWGSYLAASICGQISAFKSTSVATVGELASVVGYESLGDLATLSAAATLIYLTFRITALQERARLGADLESTFG